MTEALKTPDLYDRDFYAWTQDQAGRLRARASFDNCGDIDWEHAAEEIESLGRSQRSEIRSRLLVVLLHLLKWSYRREQRSGGWKGTLIEQRDQILQEMEDSPSLQAYPETVMARQYRTARVKAALETGLDDAVFPRECPFTIEQVLDPDYYPEASA